MITRSSQNLSNPMAPLPGEALTPREREILALLAEGLCNKDIAVRLYLCDQTVKNRVSEIYGKLGVASRTQAALWALQHGLVSPPENADSK